MNEETVRKLREVMLNELGEADLRAICADLGLNFDELGGLGVFGKTRSILEAARERNLLPSLTARVRELRPEAFKIEESRPATGDGRTSAAPPASSVEPSSAPQRRPTDMALAADATVEPRPRDVLAGIPPRVRTIAVIVAALVVLVAVLTLAQPRPAGPGAETDAAPAATLPTEATPQIAAAEPITAAEQTEIAASGALTEPASMDAGATPPAPEQPAPAIEPTPTLSESHPAAQTVITMNRQLLEFYQGKVTSNDLRQYWRPPAYQIVVDFANRTLRQRLGINLATGDPIEVDLQYVRAPALVALGNQTATTLSREYWRYTNPRTNRSLCETRDYTYIMVEEDGKYYVREFSGELISSACRTP
jgi:hypothetical protein